MFSVGDLIVYSETGVCRVEQIGPPPFDPKAKREYYTLSPMNCRETIYVPVDTQVFMRPILSREAIWSTLLPLIIRLKEGSIRVKIIPRIISTARISISVKL